MPSRTLPIIALSLIFAELLHCLFIVQHTCYIQAVDLSSELVCIHDSARPLVTAGEVGQVWDGKSIMQISSSLALVLLKLNFNKHKIVSLSSIIQENFQTRSSSRLTHGVFLMELAARNSVVLTIGGKMCIS